MTKFILLRHGQTDWNIRKLYQGHADIPLNETGMEQILRAADLLKDTPIDVIYSSDLTRAKQTAEAVHRYHPLIPLILDSRMRERGFGEYEGKPYAKDLMNPGIREEMAQNPLTFKFTGGESIADVSERAKEVLAEISEEYPDKTVLLVSHGSFLTVISALINNEDLAMRKKYFFNNAEPVYLN